MPVIAYSSLGREFFSGKFKAVDYEGAQKFIDKFAQRGYLCEENMLRLRRAEELENRYGVSVPEIAMRYVFSNQMNINAANNPQSGRGRIFGGITAMETKQEIFLRLVFLFCGLTIAHLGVTDYRNTF